MSDVPTFHIDLTGKTLPPVDVIVAKALELVDDEWVCDSCGKPCLYKDLTYHMDYPATRIDPEEGVLLCEDCLGDNDE